MATFTLYNRTKETTGASNIAIDQGRIYIHTGAQADTLTLPTDCPIGYNFRVVNNAAFTITFAAPGSETVVGDTALAATVGEIATLVKATSTKWISALDTTGT